MDWIKNASGKPLPHISSAEIEIATQSDGGTNAEGDWIEYVIGDDKLKIKFILQNLTSDEFKEVLQFFDRKYGGAYAQVYTLIDPRSNSEAQIEMRVSNRTGKALQLGWDGSPAQWIDVSFTLEET